MPQHGMYLPPWLFGWLVVDNRYTKYKIDIPNPTPPITSSIRDLGWLILKSTVRGKSFLKMLSLKKMLRCQCSVEQKCSDNYAQVEKYAQIKMLR